MKKIKKIIGLLFVSMFLILFGYSQNVFAANEENSIVINDTLMSFNRIIYVDGTTGSDESGNGDETKPFKTISKAQSVAVDGNAIYIKAGVYDLSYTGCGLYEESHRITFIGDADKTVIVSDGTRNSGRDNHGAAFLTDCSAYNIIFKVTFGNRYTNYSTAFVGSGAMYRKQYGKFYNCVFEGIDKAGCLCYANGNIYVEFNNCSFVVPQSLQEDYCYSNYGIDYTVCRNCAINTSFSGYTSKISCLQNVTYTPKNYGIASAGWLRTGTGTNPDGTKANIGVYGGQIAWGIWENKDGIININPVNNMAKVNDKIDADIVVDNTKEIQAEHFFIKYDIAKVDFLGWEAIKGVKLTRVKQTPGLIEVAASNKNKTEDVKRALLKVHFKAKKFGNTLIKIDNASIANNKYKRDLTREECGSSLVYIR